MRQLARLRGNADRSSGDRLLILSIALARDSPTRRPLGRYTGNARLPLAASISARAVHNLFMPERRESNMKKIAVALLMVGSLSMAGQASAHGNGGGDVIGALIGGAVLGAVVTSVLNPAPMVAYQPPVYAQPVYAQQAYQPPPAYAGPPPGYCYDRYQRAYVACGAPPPGQYGYSEPQPGW